MFRGKHSCETVRLAPVRADCVFVVQIVRKPVRGPEVHPVLWEPDTHALGTVGEGCTLEPVRKSLFILVYLILARLELIVKCSMHS